MISIFPGCLANHDRAHSHLHMIVGVMKDQKLKLRILHVSPTLGCACRKNSTPSIGCHGHAGGMRPDQTRKTPKDLSVHESEENERGKSVGLYVVCMYYIHITCHAASNVILHRAP